MVLISKDFIIGNLTIPVFAVIFKNEAAVTNTLGGRPPGLSAYGFDHIWKIPDFFKLKHSRVAMNK